MVTGLELTSGDLLYHHKKQVVFAITSIDGVLRQVRGLDALGREWRLGYDDVARYEPSYRFLECLVERHIFGSAVAWVRDVDGTAMPMKIDVYAHLDTKSHTMTRLPRGHWDIDVLHGEVVYGHEIDPYARHIAYTYKILRNMRENWDEVLCHQFDTHLYAIIGEREQKQPVLASMLPVDICQAALRTVSINIYDVHLYHPVLTSQVGQLAHEGESSNGN